MTLRFLPAGPRCLLVELSDLSTALSLLDALLADPVAGVAEIVPAARTLMVTTAAGVPADAALARTIRDRLPSGGGPLTRDSGDVIELPVQYDGEDLEDVARLMDLTTAEVIAAHQDALWQVAFCGFAPGFAYMTCQDARFGLPRRPAPRTRIPAGAVALAGPFCGIYPRESPGGWQLIGRTETPMWDLDRDPPALLRPGTRVRFVEGQGRRRAPAAPSVPQARGLRVLASAFPILVQDLGRAGQAGQGVSASGALDRGALRRANRAVGNAPGTPALEITLGPVRLEAEEPLTLALSGASQARLVHPVHQLFDPGAAFALDAGDRIEIAAPAKGMRSYLALRGGFQVAAVLGSASTDTLSGIGPPALAAGDALAAAHGPATAVAAPEPAPDLPAAGELVLLPVVLGPRADWFGAAMLDRFLAQEWQVTAQSSRVGIRLAGDPLTRDGAELPSEGCPTGAIQIPHSGQPVLFLADHPLTGGYPVIAVVHPDALDLAGQLPPGARVRFQTAGPFASLDPEQLT